MSRREFDPATDSEADGEEEEVANHSAESCNDDEEEMTGGKKKRAKLALKNFVEVKRWESWDRIEMSDTDILAHIREMVKLERFPLEQFPRGKVVCFVLFCLDLGNASIVL